jgi:pimeloyl-ACP methyl ester carboxylesterase
VLRSGQADVVADRKQPIQTAVMERFTSFDGLELAYLDAGEGDPVVLLHGFAADHYSNWVATGVVDALVSAARRVIALDARGHGASAKRHDPRAYANDAMVRDVQSLFDHLSLVDVDVVGYSMGSIVAGRLAPREPRVRSLVLGGVGGDWGDQRPLDVVAIADALEKDDPSGIDSRLASAFRNFVDHTGADRLALAALQRSREGETTDVSAISVPTLILAGDADQLAGSAEALARRIPGAISRTLDGNHLSVVRDPQFSQSIVTFVTSMASRTSTEETD